MRIFSALAIFMLLTGTLLSVPQTTASAQPLPSPQSPTPQSALPQSTGAIRQNVLFKEAERRIIEDYFGIHKNTPSAQTPGYDSDQRDDYGKKGKKAKKAKKGNKGKGHAKGRSKGQSKGLPPGLAKKSELPPGLAKRQSLPSGLKTRRLPRELETRLPPVPEGQQRVIVDNNVVLIEQGTRVVLDILEGVIIDAIK